VSAPALAGRDLVIAPTGYGSRSGERSYRLWVALRGALLPWWDGHLQEQKAGRSRLPRYH